MITLPIVGGFYDMNAASKAEKLNMFRNVINKRPKSVRVFTQVEEDSRVAFYTEDNLRLGVVAKDNPHRHTFNKPGLEFVTQLVMKGRSVYLFIQIDKEKNYAISNVAE